MQNRKNDQAPSPGVCYKSTMTVRTNPIAEVTFRDYKARVLRVLAHVQQHLDETLGLEDLSQVACFSPYHFHRIFRGMIGESVKEYVRRLRLERAAFRLRQGVAPVIGIALEAGYESHAAFTRAFRAAYGVAPSRFRACPGVSIPRTAPSGIHYGELFARQHFKAQPFRIHRMKVTIQNIPPLRLAFLRHVGPYAEVGKAWEQLLTVLGQDGVLGGDTQFIGICHDDPEATPPEKIRYDACVTVDAAYRPPEPIGLQITEGGDYAVTTHFGPYAKLGKTYVQLLGQWLPRSGRTLRAAPCFEVYLNTPENTAPEDLLTDVCAPLEPLQD
jgi:AraC family transcriptional regulator